MLAAPVAALVVVASIAVADKVGAASEGAEVGGLAESTTLVAKLVNDLQKERSLAGGLLNDSSSAAGRSQFGLQNELTDKASRDLAEAVSVDAEGSAERFKTTVNDAVAPLSGLPELRAQVLGGAPSGDPLQVYTDAIAGLLDANSQVATLADDDRLSQQVRSYVALSRYKEQVAQQVALLYDVFTDGGFGEVENQYTKAVLLVANQDTLERDFKTSATPEQLARFEEATSGRGPETVINIRDQALEPNDEQWFRDQAVQWIGLAGRQVDTLGDVEASFGADVRAAASSQESDASREALLYGAGALAIVLFSIGFAILVSRSIVGPLRRLTESALQVRDELPSVVEQIKEPGDASSHFEPIKVESQDEVGRLAAAFNSVYDVAVEVASEQASLRASISDMVLNLARRNQSLLDRQLQYLDDLEDAETDPDSLQDLFTLDHLATRMRRNAESLLVLAGADPSRRRREPVAVADVIRAAGSEVEDYARIDIIANSPLAVTGSAAASVAHLLAELLENATAFSPPATRVNVTTEQAGEAVRVVISDRGLGMSEEELAEANDRLARPAMIDVALSKQLGFSVVARVADRFGIRVRLTATPEGGVTATVVLPPSVLTAMGGAEADAPASSNGAHTKAAEPATTMDDALPSAPESPEGLEGLPTAPPERAPQEAPAARQAPRAPDSAPSAREPKAPPAPRGPQESGRSRPAPRAPQAPPAPRAPQAPPAPRAPQPAQRRPIPQRPAPAPQPVSSRPVAPSQPSGAPELTPAGLPRRTRKEPLAGTGAAARPAAPAAAAPKIERSPDQLRAMLSRFQQGTQSGRQTPAGADTPFQPTEDAT